jgi:2-polyprenyl-6-hydroxyphenyl methylase/3-demethylubiquinone-9 3-methyltransferase
MKENYYAEKLNAGKLYKVYQTAIPRVRQYLDAEIDFVRKGLKGDERILELGAGYGRIMKELAPFAGSIVGIDIAEESIELGKEYLKDCPNTELYVMDAHELNLGGDFDVVLCLQNGLSAIKGGSPETLLANTLKLVKNGGRAYYSTYSPKFWEYRVAWFKEQADKDLLGELDMEKTKNGEIVCKDGFRATTFTGSELENLGKASGCKWQIVEVDESSIFLVIQK